MNRVRASCLVIALVVPLLATSADAQTFADVRTSRPRLFIAGAEMDGAPRTRAQITAIADGGERLAELKAASITGPARVASAGLRRLLDGSDDAAVADALAEIDTLASMSTLDSEQALLLAIGFDWLHDAPGFDAARRQAAADALKSYAEWANRLFDVDGGGDIFDHRAWLATRSALAAAVALKGEAEEAEALFDRAMATFLINLAPALCYTGGAWHESIDATLLGLGRAATDLLLLVRGATGVDPRKRCPEEFVELARFGAWHLLPGGWLAQGDLSPLRDAHGAGYLSVFDAFGVLEPSAGPAWGAGTSRKLRALGATYQPEELWRAVLFERAGVPAEFPGGEGVARFGRGTVEQFVIRSGFDADSSVFSFRAGDWFTEADHLDQGGFSLFHKGWLAVDSGVHEGIGTAHREAYAMRSVAHNVVTVRRESMAYPSRHPDVPAVNDGGQRIVGLRDGKVAPPSRYLGMYTEGRNGEHAFDTADVTGFVAGDGLIAIEAELQRAYDPPRVAADTPKRLSQYVRRVVWLGDGLLLIQDRLGLVQAEDPVRWLLHTPVAPVRSGSHWMVSNGGALGVRTLLPSNAETTVVGGSGREFYVDGRNVPPVSDSRPPGAGTHRLEVAAPAGERELTFLHALGIGDGEAALARIDALQLVQGSGVVGARRGDELYLLPEGSAQVEEAVYRADSEARIEHHVIGVKPDIEYLVAKNGLELFPTPRSTRDGLLTFSSDGGGRFTIAARLPRPKPADPEPFVDPCTFGDCDFGSPVVPCGCSSGMSAGGAGWVWLLLGFALLGVRQCRRRR